MLFQAKHCNFFKGETPWFPTDTIERLTVQPDPQLCFYFPIHPNAEFFPSWLMP